MQGVIIHYDGKIRRFLKGRENGTRLDVMAVTPVPKSCETPLHPGERLPRDFWQSPLCFVFSIDSKTFAVSRRVSLTKGRRYPEVEHWFVMPDESPHVTSPEVTRSAIPVLT